MQAQAYGNIQEPENSLPLALLVPAVFGQFQLLAFPSRARKVNKTVIVVRTVESDPPTCINITSR